MLCVRQVPWPCANSTHTLTLNLCVLSFCIGPCSLPHSLPGSGGVSLASRGVEAGISPFSGCVPCAGCIQPVFSSLLPLVTVGHGTRKDLVSHSQPRSHDISSLLPGPITQMLPQDEVACFPWLGFLGAHQGGASPRLRPATRLPPSSLGTFYLSVPAWAVKPGAESVSGALKVGSIPAVILQRAASKPQALMWDEPQWALRPFHLLSAGPGGAASCFCDAAVSPGAEPEHLDQ